MSATRSLTVTVSDDDGDGVWVAFDNVSGASGQGYDPTHALFSWLRDLDARHREFARNRDRLAPGLRKELAAIEGVLSKETGR